MKSYTTRIMRGKRYNTETATKVATWDNDHLSNDFHYCEETLYRSPGGKWFLVGAGGALSKYAQSCGQNSTCGGSEWLVMTEQDAMEWLELHHKTEALEQYFADKIQDA